jgi:hypothetical protein
VMSTRIDDVEFYTTDTPEKRQMCLNCSLPDCCDCSPTAIKKAQQHEIRMRLYMDGKVDREIAAATGVHAAAIYQWRKKHDLPPNNFY